MVVIGFKDAPLILPALKKQDRLVLIIQGFYYFFFGFMQVEEIAEEYYVKLVKINIFYNLRCCQVKHSPGERHFSIQYIMVFLAQFYYISKKKIYTLGYVISYACNFLDAT